MNPQDAEAVKMVVRMDALFLVDRKSLRSSRWWNRAAGWAHRRRSVQKAGHAVESFKSDKGEAPWKTLSEHRAGIPRGGR